MNEEGAMKFIGYLKRAYLPNIESFAIGFSPTPNDKERQSLLNDVKNQRPKLNFQIM